MRTGGQRRSVRWGSLICLAARVPDWSRWAPGSLWDPLQWLAGISYGGAGPFLQSVTMIVAALSLGWLLTRFVERSAHQGLMIFYDQATSTHRVASKLSIG